MVHVCRSPAHARSLKIVYTPEALGDLHRFSRDITVRIFDKMDWFASQPDPLHFARPLKGNPRGAAHRFRIGVYRILKITLRS